MNQVGRIITIGFFSAFIILAVVLGIMWYQFISTSLLINQSSQTFNVRIPTGMGAQQLAYHLKKQGLIKYPAFFLLLIKINGASKRLQAGEYHVTSTMTAPELLANIEVGKVVQHAILLVEGWTFKDVKQALLANENLKHDLSTLSDQAFLKKLNIPHAVPEGLFFPDTYYFYWDDSDIDILKKAHEKMQAILEEQWQQREINLPYKTAYKALIVASLIEKETAIKSEKPLIASVIINRLKKRMPLQIDPTVLYGLGRSYESPITKLDLKTVTPYNTYMRYGLPPTPIGMPGLSSIVAALHPAKTNFYYYVAKGDGSHQFSKTYAQHLQAVQQYRQNEMDNIVRKEVKQYLPFLQVKSVCFIPYHSKVCIQ